MDTITDPYLRGELQSFGTAGQHGLGADVDADARQFGGTQLPAHSVGLLEQRDPCRAAEDVRRGQTGDASADDNYVRLAHSACR